MDAKSIWFRETGEGRLKEQLLIETMFCVNYLGKGIAARCVFDVRRALLVSCNQIERYFNRIKQYRRFALAVCSLCTFGSNKLEVTVLNTTVSDTQTHVGYVAGGGIEWIFAPNWSAKGEYLYTSFGSEDYFSGVLQSRD